MKHFLCSSAYWVCSLCKQRVFRYHLHWENKNLTPTLSLSVHQYICMPDQNLIVVSEHTTVLNIAQYFLLWKTAANVSTNQKSEWKKYWVASKRTLLSHRHCLCLVLWELFSCVLSLYIWLLWFLIDWSVLWLVLPLIILCNCVFC